MKLFIVCDFGGEPGRLHEMSGPYDRMNRLVNIFSRDTGGSERVFYCHPPLASMVLGAWHSQGYSESAQDF